MIEDFLEKSPCGYFSFMDDGTIYTVNDTLCSLLGYQKEELKGRNVEILFTIPTRIFYQTHFFPLVKMQGHAEEIFLSLLTKDNEYLPVLLNASRVEQPVTYTSCAFIVVPNRKKFEDELVSARNAAERALKENSELTRIQAELQSHSEELDRQIQTVNKQNHELKQLNHAVTHSLKEPIRKILVYTEKMQLEGLPEGLRPNIQRLSRASEQMRIIVSGIQQYIWLISGENKFTSIDLNALIQRAATHVREENPGILIDIAVETLPSPEADREQIQLLVYHILSNALNFRKGEKANVSVTGTIVKRNSFRVMADKYKYEDFLKLEFRDEGIGFDPVYRENIFELFRKLNYAKGVGLGLALCKKIAENHAGSIEAHSKLNEFTIITIYLPFHQMST